MTYRDLFKDKFIEPQKLLAILILIISCYLTLMELGSFWQAEDGTRMPPRLEKLKAAISLQSPLFSSSIFGIYVPKIDEVDIRQSSLNIEIQGILFSSEEKSSQVLIKTAAGEEKIFIIGDSLPGGAIIKKISKDQIILLYQGVLESITMKPSELKFYKPKPQL